MQQISIVNDPFRILIEACKDLYPDLKAEIYFMPQIQLEEIEKGALGLTDFPEDGTTPEIFIKAEQTIEQSVDIMAHELAHVAAGVDADHGAEWKASYDDLYRKYHELVDAEDDESKKNNQKEKYEAEAAELQKAAAPLIELMQKKYNPMQVAVVRQNRVEILSSEIGVPVEVQE